MRVLKTIVITLGVIIVAGFGLMVYGLTQGWHRGESPLAMSRVSGPPSFGTLSSGATWGPVTLGIAGERIAGVTASGDLLVIQMSDGQASRLLVVDPRSGRIVGSFVAGSAP